MRATMTRSALVCCCLAASAMAAAAQQPGAQGQDARRDSYVTSTGATVDKPGEPQASAPTQLDRNLQKQNNQIDSSICKGC